MRITIVTIGSRGDVQPFVALGKGLRAAGIHTRVATHRTFESFVERHGLEFAPLAGDIREIMESEQGLAILSAGGNPVTMLRRLFRAAAPLATQVVHDALAATRDADLIIGSTLGYLNAYHAAELYRIPIIAACPQLLTINDLYPASVFPPLPPAVPVPLRRSYNRRSYRLSDRLLWMIASGMGNRARVAATGLPPLRFADLFESLESRHTDILYGISRQVLPFGAELPPGAHLTGYWFLDQQDGWQPPDDLLRFLESGDPPVYIGFGSMSNRDPESVTRMVIAALERTGGRGVLLSGWRGMSTRELPPNICMIDEAPHDWLFPRMAAIVHHGGAGTTAAALRAGKPQVVVPFSTDQPFWARRMLDLGVSAATIPRGRLTAARLARAIETAAGDRLLADRAARLGRLIAAEDGVANAVAVIDRLMRDGRIAPPRPTSPR